MWPDVQQQFAAALRDPDHPLPDAVGDGSGRASTKRFGVYRNNVMVGLTEALEATYPVVASLVGEAFFKDLAHAFIRQSWPGTPVLLDYGGGFGDFITCFEPAKDLSYLADVAHLEWAWNRAYHAADATPIAISALADVPDTVVEDVRLDLHPSLHLIRSPWPIVSIWQAHQGDETEAGLAQLPQLGQRTMVVRPDLDVTVRAIDENAFALVSALADGKTLGQALGALDDAGDIDVSAHLAQLFETGSIVGLS